MHGVIIIITRACTESAKPSAVANDLISTMYVGTVVIANDIQTRLSSSESCGFAYVIIFVPQTAKWILGSFSREPFYKLSLLTILTESRALISCCSLVLRLY